MSTWIFVCDVSFLHHLAFTLRLTSVLYLHNDPLFRFVLHVAVKNMALWTRTQFSRELRVENIIKIHSIEFSRAVFEDEDAYDEDYFREWLGGLSYDVHRDIEFAYEDDTHTNLIFMFRIPWDVVHAGTPIVQELYQGVTFNFVMADRNRVRWLMFPFSEYVDYVQLDKDSHGRYPLSLDD